MSTEFASASYTAGQLNAMVKLLKKQAGEDGPCRFLRGEITVTEPEHAWREQDGVIYFSVTSDGTTGEEWIKRLEGKNFRVSDYAKSVLRSSDFKPTDGVTTEIAVLKGMLFSDDDRVTKKICAEADKRNLTKPNAEVACLIREKFTDKELEAMGRLWGIVAMHEPIKDSDGAPLLLDAHRVGVGRWLHAYFGHPDFRWLCEHGFAFAVSQV
ncbi:hypothetical protein KKA27_03695 [Patescibacteria group bacterium]|nr:hypothetical protein [Patescibacteria group bacterium]MBU2632921.1 hypothetical protein [Patescibacteria group bacterium]